MTFVQGLWNQNNVITDIISSDSFKNYNNMFHSHAFGLFVLYLFLHFYFVNASNNINNNRKNNDSITTTTTTSTSSATFKRSSTSPRSFLKSVCTGKDDDIMTSSPTSSIRSISSISGDESSDIASDDDDSINNYNNLLGENIERMSVLNPHATIAERRRFLVASNNDIQKASHRLNAYSEWRQRYVEVQNQNGIHIKPTHDRDYDIWVESCMIARIMNNEIVPNIVLPRVIRTFRHRNKENENEKSNIPSKAQATTTTTTTEGYITDKDGSRMFHIVPATMDDKLAKQSTYTVAVAIYLDKSIDRESMEKVTICMDVRAGRGWPNIHAVRLVPFMKNSLKLLLPLYPERLYKCVVYPLPSAFFYLWTVISKCIDPDTRNKIRVVAGKCTIESSPPTDKLITHLGKDQALLLEKSRVECFKA
jgi:hypothetical protein